MGPRKTGLLATGGVEDAAYDAAPLTLGSTPDAPPSKITLMPQKKWLGVPWSMSLDFRPFLDKQLGASRREMARLSGLSEAGALPLPLAVVAFEAKVDSQLQYARWLHVLVEGAEELLDSVFEDWAWAFFKAPPWGTAALYRAELGWALTGFARSVRAAALRRAVLWRSQSLAGRTFVRAHTSPGRTWARRSLEVLQSWGIPDYPDSGGEGRPPLSPEAYKSMLTTRLREASRQRWTTSAARHVHPCPYMLYAPRPSNALPPRRVARAAR